MKNKRKAPKEEYDLLLGLLDDITDLKEKGIKLIEKYNKEHKSHIPDYFTQKIENYPDNILAYLLRISTKTTEIRKYLTDFYEPVEDFNRYGDF